MLTGVMPPVAILAGGLAARMRPRTEAIPKVLLPVANEPFVVHQFRLLKREGVCRVVLCLGHLGEMVREFVGDGHRFGLDVAYSLDGQVLLGTGGALIRALPLLGETFFVLYGDCYLDIALDPVLRAFQRSGTPGLMTVFRNEGRWDTSNVLFENGLVARYDKRTPSREMSFIDYGLGILTEDSLARWRSRNHLDLADVYATLAAEGRLSGYEARHRFYEIGTPDGLSELDAYLRKP